MFARRLRMKTVELGRSSKRPRQPPESDNLFGWTVFILLLCGFALACWIGTFYIFTHPEEPFNYQILAKLKKLDPPRRFELTAAPTGEFLSPEKVLSKYGSMTASQLDDESKNLMRAYLRNYDHQVGKVPYLTGKFTVLDSYAFSPSKFFDSGVAVVAQSVDVPTIYIEHLFPAAPEHLPAMQRTLATGLGIELRRSYDLSAIVHVENLEGGRLLLTCVPLLYGPYGTIQIGSGFQLDPPKVVNLKAGLPVVAQPQLHEAEQRFAQYRRAMEAQETASTQTNGRPQPNLVGSEPTPTTLPCIDSGKDRSCCGKADRVASPVPKTNPHLATATTPAHRTESLAGDNFNADFNASGARRRRTAVTTFFDGFSDARD